MRMVNISNEKSMQSYTARCSRYKNKYTNLVCGKTAVGRNYNLPRDTLFYKFENLTVGITDIRLRKPNNKKSRYIVLKLDQTGMRL